MTQSAFNPSQANQQLAAMQSQVIRMQQNLTALRIEFDMHKAGRVPSLPVEFRSQFGEDLIAWTLFGGKSDDFSSRPALLTDTAIP